MKQAHGQELFQDPTINMVPLDAPLTLLPDPEPREVWCPVISVDDHVLEPGNLFEGVPVNYRDQVPKLIEDDEGHLVWQISGRDVYITGNDGTVGRPRPQWFTRAMRRSEFRAAVLDADERIADMDLAGVWASLNFPSLTWGFAGYVLSRLPDEDLALACVRSYNDWVVEEWWGSHPDRFVPCQLPYLGDPERAAEEVRRNATRGVHAVSFSENPVGIGYPSLYSGYWDPFFQACAETQTVLNLHVGSSSNIHRPSPESPSSVMIALFPLNGVETMIDWIFARVPVRFPTIKIAMSEAGVSWVPMALERLDRSSRIQSSMGQFRWPEDDPCPVEVAHRNFWFTSIEDPSAFRLLDVIGEDKVMLEIDYPHGDGTWPDSQALFRTEMEHLPRSVITKIAYENASALYQHPLPPPSMIEGATLFGGGPSSAT